MARWRLTEPHYLNVPGIEWEQVTTDRVTQRPVRRKFPVPQYLDPRAQDDWNYRRDGMDGEIIVCHKDKGQPNDIVFVGDPTPGMLPLDDEAKEISGRFTWTPTQGIDDVSQQTSYQAKILQGLVEKLGEASVQSPAGAPAGFEKFMESMAVMMQQQTQLLAMLLEKNQATEFARQVQAIGAEPPAEEEPLPEAEEPTQEELDKAAEAAADAEAASRTRAQTHAERAAGRRL